MPPPKSLDPPSVSRIKRTGVCIAFVLFIFVLGTVIVYNHIKREEELVHQKIVIPAWDVSEDLPLIDKSNKRRPTAAPTVKKVFKTPLKQKCNDTNWCMPMPKKSYFRFDPPKDAERWKKASIQAMTGEQVLLKRTIQTFPNFLDFLDGDITFRKWNQVADIFIEKRSDLNFLKNPLPAKRRLADFDWEGKGLPVIPQRYETHEWNRAPVLKMGYFAFQKHSKANYFEGPQVGEAILGLREFLNKWKEVKNEIKTPFIVFHGSNENWGWLSTQFPNRTIDWGRCCDEEEADLLDFLNHDKTLMLMVEQHSNFTHPKLVTFPRGLPLTNEHVNRLVWDTMRQVERSPALRKNQLVFTASSKWGARPQIIECVGKKFAKNPADFQGVGYEESQMGRIAPKEYYKRLAQSRTGLALSGLGADTFRLWELMTMGSVAVIERAMGLDKMVWRLPALIVDDFDQVTPELLRVAYVEALYRVNEWQYEKLTQSFWWSFIGNVSSTKSSKTVLDRFPAFADETTFTRPLVPFDCWKTNSCGKGTKKIPTSSC